MSTVIFPEHFIWGTATSAYQIEGAYNLDGRGMSIWDTFARTPGKVFNGDTGDIACDSYHRFEEDIQLMKELGIQAYRFSVSWSRIFPEGRGKLNQQGLNYYIGLVDCLLAHNIEPYCTLYHWDLPQTLQDDGGWANRQVIDDFVHYADTLFTSLNGKVKHWITLNEPWCISFLSNYIGVHAPGHQNLQLAVNIAHHLLLAHGKTVKLFRDKGYEGKIGYAPNTTWSEPYSNQAEDIAACARNRAWFAEWFLDPIFKGCYPSFMVEWFQQQGVKLEIHEGDMQLIQQAIDFIGINYYTGGIGRYKKGYGLFDYEEIDIGADKTDIHWDIYSEGFYKILTFINERYGDIPIYITENGACFNDGLIEGEIKDIRRVRYLMQHIIQLHRALSSGVNIKGYFVWSLLDNFEWAEGYSKRFGIVHVDFETLTRTKKLSYFWYQQVVNQNGLTDASSKIVEMGEDICEIP